MSASAVGALAAPRWKRPQQSSYASPEPQGHGPFIIPPVWRTKTGQAGTIRTRPRLPSTQSSEGPRTRTTAHAAARRRRASSMGRVVEVAGIEPASFSTSPGLLRAQPAVLFSAPAVTQASCRRAQSLLGVPPSPATGPDGGSSLLMPGPRPEALLG